MPGMWRPTLPSRPAEDVALTRVIAWLKGTSPPEREAYRVSLAQLLQSEVLSANADERERQRDGNGRYISTNPRLEVNTEPFFAAAWTLVARGILAPLPAGGPDQGLQAHVTDFLVTERGKRWLTESRDEAVLPAEYARFAAALVSYESKLGIVYRERALEAVNCYHANCFYACCVMAGASSEAILLELVTAKTNDRASAEKELRSAKGRQKLVDALKQQRNGLEQRVLDHFVDLSAYFRDDAAHGAGAPIDEMGAHLALMTLLRLARFSVERWAALTS